MPSASYASPAPKLAAPIFALSVLLSIAAVWAGLPVGIVMWAGLLAAAMQFPAPNLTGTKGEAANDHERKQQDIYRSWIRARGAMAGTNSLGHESIWPGIPVRTPWLASTAVGLIVAALPLHGGVIIAVIDAVQSFLGFALGSSGAPWSAVVPDQFPWWAHLISGVLAAHTVSVSLARRRMVDEQPAPTIPKPSALFADARPRVLVLPLFVAASIALGVALGDGIAWKVVLSLGLSLGSAWLLVRTPCADISLKQWRATQEARAEWDPRFADGGVFKAKDGAPKIVKRTVLAGGGTVDEMIAPAALGAMGVISSADTMTASIGGGSTVTVLFAPNTDAEGQDIPGSRHPVKVRVVTLDSETEPDLMDPNTDEQSAAIAHEVAMMRGATAGGIAVPMFLDVALVNEMPAKVSPEDRPKDEDGNPKPRSLPSRVIRWIRGIQDPEPVYPDDAPNAVWISHWEVGQYGPPWENLIDYADDVSGAFGHQIVIDKRKQFILTGDPLSEESVYTGTEATREGAVHIVQELEWNGRWETTLQQGANPPTPRWEITTQADLPMRFSPPVTVHSQLFATRNGLDAGTTIIDPRPKDLEKGMATSMHGAPFVSIVGYPEDGGVQGSRNPHFFLVRWAHQPVPRTPQELVPAAGRVSFQKDASAWVLAGQINKAFISNSVKLPKPEIAEATALTKPDSPKHVWKATLRLHGGTTLAEVRKKADAIRSGLGTPWMRIKEAESGRVTLYMGEPDGARFRDESAALEVWGMNFEQAFIDAGLTNASGVVPTLVKSEQLATNDQIQVLDFQMPPGMEFARVRGNKDKIRTNLDMEFVDAHPLSASRFRLFTCKVDPLPTSVSIPFDDLPTSGLSIGFADNALGERVSFDMSKGPHLLVLGATGSGKAQPLSARIPVPVSDRFASGWATIGELEPGDRIYTETGAEAIVRSLSEETTQETWEIELSDGQIVPAGPDHLWDVADHAVRANQARFDQIRTAGMTEHQADNAAEARRLRSLSLATEYGSFGSMEQIADAAGVSVDRLYTAKVHDSAAVEKVRVATRKAIRKVPVAEFAAWAGDHQRSFFGTRLEASLFSGHQGEKSVRELADIALGCHSNRGQRDRMKRLVAESGLGDGIGGYEVREVDYYPVEETITRLADWYERRSVSERPIDHQVVTTTELAQMVADGAGRGTSVSIATADGIDGPDIDLPVAPYTLGAWLGDGRSSCAQITSMDDGILDAIRSDGYAVEPLAHHALQFAIRGLHTQLRTEGLLGAKRIPASYLRASRAQRLALVQGILDTDGHVSESGSMELTLADHDLIEQVRELLRSLGVRVGPVYSSANHYSRNGQRVDGFEKHRITFTTSLPVFRLARKASRIPRENSGGTRQRLYVRAVRRTGRTETMRCLRVESPRHLYLTGGFVPTHNSVTMSSLLYGGLVAGFDVVVIDPTKAGLDFAFCREYAIAPFGEDVFSAASILNAVYAEANRRRNLNRQHGVVNIDKLPAEIRPRHILVLIDEFTSLLGRSKEPPKSDDPTVDHQRLEIAADNAARQKIGTMVSKLAREARSFGIHLVLGTQKLAAKTLDDIPNANDLKTNLSRIAQGNTTFGERQSAFRSPESADSLGDGEVRQGRGLYEGLEYASPRLFQAWYAPQEELRDRLGKLGISVPSSDRVLNPEDPRYKVSPPEEFVEVKPVLVIDDEEEVEIEDLSDIDLDLDLDFDLDDDDDDDDDLDGSDDDAEDAEDDPGETMDADDPAPAVPPADLDLSSIQSPNEPDLGVDLDDIAEPARLDLDEGRADMSSWGDTPWEAFDEISTLDEIPPLRWDFGTSIDEESPAGLSYRELLEDVDIEIPQRAAGADDLEIDVPAEQDETADEPAPAPENEMIDFSFQPVKTIRN